VIDVPGIAGGGAKAWSSCHRLIGEKCSSSRQSGVSSQSDGRTKWLWLQCIHRNTTTTTTAARSRKMNVLKNFEALFVVTLGLACAANYALDSAPQQQQQQQAKVATVAMAAPANMQVVVVSAKRLNAEQKLQSLVDEQKAVLNTAGTASKM
jgi:hypothetical protein